jgi:extradiol dioxygenase family protein
MTAPAVSARFHLSLAVADLEGARAFYAGLLGCPIGRRGPGWIDFSFFGHQLTCTFHPDRVRRASPDDLEGLHFGAIVPLADFDRLAAALTAAAVKFLVEPRTEDAGASSERRKMVFLDPSGNAVEIKSYRDESRLYSSSTMT